VSSPLWAVLPGRIDDPAAPSGGNLYDRKVLDLLAGRATGPAAPAPREVHEIPIHGSWPTPEVSAREALASALDDIPDKSDVLVDGLVGCGVPEILEPHARRLRLIVLVHLPLSDETGLSATEAAALRERERRTLLLADTIIATSEAAAQHISDMHQLSAREPGPAQHISNMHQVSATGLGPARHLSDMHELSATGLGRGDGAADGPAGVPAASPFAPPPGVDARAASTDSPVFVGGVAVVAPGVDLAPLAAGSEAGGRLLCVASVTPRKGQDLLVRVLEQQLADLEWDCTFVGALVKPVAHSHPGIRFVGPLVGEALAAAYGEADLFVLPSRAETYGMVITEALARGLPVVATRVGGVPEALGTAPNGVLPDAAGTAPDAGPPDASRNAPGAGLPDASRNAPDARLMDASGTALDGGPPGMLVPPEDPAALAAALRAWLTEPELRKRLRAAAKARRETLPTWSDTANRLAAVLDARGDDA
jgi:hypothetical protein